MKKLEKIQKMGKAKKRLGFLLSFCAVFCLITVCNMKVKAESMTPIQPNKAFEGKLEKADAVKYYSFTVDKDGYFTFSIGKKDMTSDTRYGWNVSLNDATTGALLYEEKGVKTSFTSERLNFKKGTKLFLKVASNVTVASYSPIDVVYTMKVTTVANTAWETESNDDAKNANKITANKNFYGNLYHKNDVDMFKYTVGTVGTQQLSFGPQNVTDTAAGHSGWNIEIYDGKSNELLYKWVGIKVKTTLPILDFQKGTSLLIKVTANSIAGAPVFITYSFKIKETTSNYWEQEDRVTEGKGWNVYKKSARIMKLDKKYYGTLWNNTDTDLFAFTPSAEGNVTLTFRPNDLSTNLGSGYKVKLLTKEGKVLLTWEGLTSKKAKKLYLKKDTYYVSISASATYNVPTDKKYTLETEYQKQVVDPVYFLEKHGNYLTWDKVSGAKGYQIHYALNKKFTGTKKKNLTKNSFKVSNLKKGKTYYVRVRAYKKTFTGDLVYGKWSDVLKVKR